MKLMMSNYKVEMIDDGASYTVKFHGPEETCYEGGVWLVSVQLPKDYPFRSPSIGFKNKIFHPNIDETSGSVCLDVINTTWSPMYELLNVFDVFLPQLLAYPNASDPLNGDAASLYLRDSSGYKDKVKEYIGKYACLQIQSRQEPVSSDSSVSTSFSSETYCASLCCEKKRSHSEEIDDDLSSLSSACDEEDDDLVLDL